MADQDQLARLRESISENNRCRSWNMWRKEHTDLYVDLSEAELQEQEMVEVDLSGTNLTGANLQNAVLYEAGLEDANLTGANLKEAKMGKVFGSNLKEACLNRGNLTGADLSKAYLHGVQLRQAKLNQAKLDKTNLNETDMWGADLSHASLHKASVNSTNLDGAVLSGAYIHGMQGNVASAINIRCSFLDIGEVPGREIVEFTDEKDLEELGRYLAQDEQRRIRFLLNKFQQQRHPLVCMETMTAKDGTEYRVEEKLREGILWITYRVKRIEDNTRFLLQIMDLHPAYTPKDSWESLRKRFIVLGIKATKARHPYIANVLEVGYLESRPLIIDREFKNRPFWLIEHFEGSSLDDWVLATDPPFAKTHVIMTQITKAIRYLHYHLCTLKREDFRRHEVDFSDTEIAGETAANAFVHGNINPSNIFISHDGQHSKLSSVNVIHWQDFAGGFTIHSSFSDFAKLPPLLLQSYRYMSIEQKRSEDCLSAKSDIFSLGMNFYYMVTKKHFFSELIAAKEDEFSGYLQGSDCSLAVKNLILRMVSQEPGQRPDIKEVHGVLQPAVFKKILYRCVSVIAVLLVGFFVYLGIEYFPAGESEKQEQIVEEPFTPKESSQKEQTKTSDELKKKDDLESRVPLSVFADSDKLEHRLKAARHPKASAKILGKLAKDEELEVRVAVAQNQATPDKILKEQAKSPDTAVRIAVAENYRTSGDILRTLANDGEKKVRKSVLRHLYAVLGGNCKDARKYILRGDLYNKNKDYKNACPYYRKAVELNPNDSASRYKLALALEKRKSYRKARKAFEAIIAIDPANLDAYVKSGNICYRLREYEQAFSRWNGAIESGYRDRGQLYKKLRKLAKNNKIKPSLLAGLAKVKNSKVKRAVAKNSCTSPKTLLDLAMDPDLKVRMAAAGTRNKKATLRMAANTKTPADVLDKLSRNRDADVRELIARHRSAPASVFARLSRDKEDRVRIAVASNANTPGEVLATMAGDSNSTVRSELIDNPNLPGHAFAKLAQEDWKMIPALVGKASDKQKKAYTDAEYYGQLKNREPHGLGIQVWNSGDKYVGQYKNGERHGIGQYTWKDGKKYIGQWKHNKINGKGILSWPNGSEYQGDFIDGKKDGRGTYRWADGKVYQGQYVKGKIQGSGVLIWPDGRKYQGELKDGRPFGQGTCTWANGDKYQGGYQNGKFHGNGSYTWSNGKKYTGQYHLGRANGKGTYLWPSGNRYEGDFHNGVMHGYGTIYRKDGSVMKRGRWKAGKYVGS